MTKKTKTKKNTKTTINNWYTDPDSSHLVQFYPNNDTLIENLHEYISTGLATNATCIVIATKSHIATLDRRLNQTIDIGEAQSSGRYLTLDARQALASFMVDGRPDKKLFRKHIGGLMRQLIKQHSRPVRAYGDMVAILWKAGNKEAVIELEELWNGLAKKHEFSLYCAYPELHFIMDQDIRSEINLCHNLHAQNFAV